MVDKILRLVKKVPPIVLTYASVIETMKIIFLSLCFGVSILMISHLLIAGEFGFCYWSYDRGWLIKF